MSEDLGENELFLLVQVAKGDSGALTHLYNKYKNDLYSYLVTLTPSRADAEDIVQDVFVWISHNRAELSGIKDFRAYIFTTARNKFLNLVKKNSRIRLTEDLDKFLLWDRDTPDDLTSDKYLREFLEKIKNELPEQQRKVHFLSRDRGLSIAQIAGEMNISQSTVKEHSSKALKTMRKRLLEYINPVLIIIFGLIYPF